MQQQRYSCGTGVLLARSLVGITDYFIYSWAPLNRFIAPAPAGGTTGRVEFIVARADRGATSTRGRGLYPTLTAC